MLKTTLRFFAPPIFPADDDKTRVARVLNALLLAFLGMLVVNILAIIYIYVAKLYVALIQMVLFLTFLLAYWLMRRGRIQLASIIFVSIQWVIYTLGLVLSGGMNSAVAVFYLANTVVTGLLLGTGAAVAHAAVSSIVGLGMVFIDVSWIPLPRFFSPPPLTNWTLMVTSLALPTTALGLTLHNLHEALGHTRQELNERKAIEQALQENENLFRNTFEQAAVGIGHVSPEGKYLRVNQRLCDLLGYTRDELLGLTFQEITFPDDLEADLTFVQRVLRGEISSYVLEKRYICKDGLILWANLTIAAVRDVDGRIEYFMGVVEDITARKLVEEARRESEAQLRAIVDASPDLMFVLDGDGRYIEIETTRPELLVVNAEAIRGKSIAEFFPEYDVRALLEAIRKTLESGETQMYQYQLEVPLGKRWFEGRTARVGVPIQGKKVVIFLARDITERKLAERALEENLGWQRLMAAISAGFVGSPADKIETMLEHSLKLLGEYLDIDRASLYTMLSQDKIRMMSSWNREDVLTAPAEIASADLPNAVCRAQKGEIVQFSRLADLPEEAALDSYFWGKGGVKSHLSVPLMTGGRLLGSLALSCLQREQAWPDELAQRVKLVGEIFANALVHKQAEEALRESEEKFRTLAESTSTAILIYQDDRWVYANPAVLEISGYSLGELLDMPFLNLIHSDYRKMILENSLARRLGEDRTLRYNCLILTRAGEERWVDATSDLIQYLGRPAGLITGHDITDQVRVNAALKESREELRALTRYLQTALEEERANIAREIHDEFGQALTALKMDLAWVMRRLPEESTLRDKLAGAAALADDTIQLVRQISSELRPGILDDLGLGSAIEWQANEFGQRTGIVCEVMVEGMEIGRGREIETALFRIFQESLTNAARHSGATQVRVHLAEDAGEVVLVVSDNGRGIAAEQLAARNSLGLIGMRERARAFGGEVMIEGAEGKGTVVTARFPIAG